MNCIYVNDRPYLYHFIIPGSFKKRLYAFLMIAYIASITPQLSADDLDNYVTVNNQTGAFSLVEYGTAAPLYISSEDFPAVQRVAKHLQNNIARVTGINPEIMVDMLPASSHAVIIGTLGKNPVINDLIQRKIVNDSQVTGKWDTYVMKTIDKPLPGVGQVLIILGSNKRGTLYGMYDLAEAIGVSPWYWWADVPVKKKSSVYITPLDYTPGEPKVKYRGIFINDEAPALSGWVHENYDGFNVKFYEHVFELILRLKGNFLWPAMWGRAFYDDDSENPRLANEYGIVISTSHHEPMMRAHVEWERYGSGPWNYAENKNVIQEFWQEGIERMGEYESIVTLAMRGDGDEPMSREANIELLQTIVKDQREIIREITGKEISDVPQVWALYKEVQEYYDRGMRVPDDVTLLLCDDNWGNLRKLPQQNEKPRAGGYGIYYHFDYVGGPRNYKWLNTVQISRVWEQMHLAYEYGADHIWVVNVGDIKPMEFPISFFLEYAWNPERFPASMLPEYTRMWAEQQFGAKHSKDIAHILTEYTRYNSRRKPELLVPDTYSLTDYREADRIVDDYDALYSTAKSINESLSPKYRDAFYQLVLHPVEACANLNRLYVNTGKNHLYAKQGRSATNSLAHKIKDLFQKDMDITNYYHQELSGGKWNHMMAQTHIGYTYWQQPDENTIPDLEEISLPARAEMGVAIEGSDNWWPEEETEAILPVFDPFNQQSYYIEIFNRGEEAFEYSAKTDLPWLKIDEETGIIKDEKRLWIDVDWDKVPQGNHEALVNILGPENSNVMITAPVFNPGSPKRDEIRGFIECNGYISMEAMHYSRRIDKNQIRWDIIPDLGRTSSALTPIPVTAPAQNLEESSPRLEYDVYFFSTGIIEVKAYLSPTLNFHNNQGLRFGVSVNDRPVEVINIHENMTFQDWEESVRTNSIVAESQHLIKEAGEHTLKIWMIDPGIVIQKIVIETQKIAPSYLGPPEGFNSHLQKP